MTSFQTVSALSMSPLFKDLVPMLNKVLKMLTDNFQLTKAPRERFDQNNGSMACNNHLQARFLKYDTSEILLV